MKQLRVIIYVLASLTAAVLLGLFINNLINNKLDQSKPTTSTSTVATQSNSTVTTVAPAQSSTAQSSQPATTTTTSTPSTASPSTTATATVTSTSVSTVKLADNSDSLLSAVGVVKAKNTISLLPQTSASVKKINFQEGDTVQEGDTIVELSGANSTDHPSQKQLKIAQTSYDNAKDALNNLVKVNNESLKTAQLQVQAAISQASAIPYDLQVIEQNQAGLKDGLNILENSYNNTLQKNQRDQLFNQNNITDLINTLNMAQNDRASTISQINDIQQTQSPAPDQTQKLTKLQAALAAQSKGIDDLYTAIDKAKYGYSTTTNTSQLGDNQILSQIQQSENQAKVLDLNLQSTKTKLGYNGQTSDALQLAQQGFQVTQAQLSSAIDSAQNQVKLAKLNLDLAQDQAANLQIKAPFSGIITSMNLSKGQSVNTQTPVAELIDPKQFQLEVGVDADTADRININSPAQIELAGKWLEVAIKSISPKVDAVTKQVKVTLQLPNIFFKINQNLQAKLPLTTALNQQTKALILPLDAVIIGTESKFVYVNDHGRAKRVEVTIGQINGDQIEILSGLNPTDEVILEGAKSLTDGQVIIIK